jgi:hypothetical protein
MAARKCKFGVKKGTSRCRKRALAGAAARSMRGLGRSTRKAPRCKFGVNKRTKACLKAPRRK